MTAERRREIRAHAARRAAAELGGVMNGWGEEIPAELYPDADEREEFVAEVSAIIHRLQRRGMAA